MERAGIKVVGDILAMDRGKLDLEFGSYAQRLYELARGIDHNPVVSNRVRKQISAEDTFPDDIPLAECETHIRKLAQKVWTASKDNQREAKTVVLKLKTKEFQSLTRSLTSRSPVVSCEALVSTALALLERVDLEPRQLYRLAGVGLSNFQLDETTPEDLVAESMPPLIAQAV
jgi:DNA polymerase-4